jgi:hypothetical protein
LSEPGAKARIENKTALTQRWKRCSTQSQTFPASA